MERYHSTAGDPPSRDMTSAQRESKRLEEQVAEFLARGGQIQQVGVQMRQEALPYVIHYDRTPVYNPELRDKSFVPKAAKTPAPASREKPVVETAQLPAEEPQTVAPTLDDLEQLVAKCCAVRNPIARAALKRAQQRRHA